MTDTVLFSLTLLGGIILFLLVAVIIDLLGSREDKQSKHQPAA